MVDMNIDTKDRTKVFSVQLDPAVRTDHGGRAAQLLHALRLRREGEILWLIEISELSETAVKHHR